MDSFYGSFLFFIFSYALLLYKVEFHNLCMAFMAPLSLTFILMLPY